MDEEKKSLYSAYIDAEKSTAILLKKNVELENTIHKLEADLDTVVKRCDLEKKYLLAEDDRKNLIINDFMKDRIFRQVRGKKILAKYPSTEPLVIDSPVPKKPVSSPLKKEANRDFSSYSSDIKVLVSCDKNFTADDVKLARQHGIYGFIFDDSLETAPDFPFCFRISNEKATQNFVEKFKDILLNKNYIRVKNNPIILVDDICSIQDYKATITKWKNDAKKYLSCTLQIWTSRELFEDSTGHIDLVNAEYAFRLSQFNLIPSNEDPTKCDYLRTVLNVGENDIYSKNLSLKPAYFSVSTSFDVPLTNYNPEYFYYWLRVIVKETRKRHDKNSRVIFVDQNIRQLASNKERGFADINAISKAIFDLPYSDTVVHLDSLSQAPTNATIAIQAHIFYTDLLNEILEQLEKIPFLFDLYISTDSNQKLEEIRRQIKTHKFNALRIKYEVVNNCGRDIYPFLKQLHAVYNNYDIICHLHTKKSPHTYFGDSWRHYIYEQLIGSADDVSKILGLFSDENVGMIFPATYDAIEPLLQINSNLKEMNALLEKMNLDKISDGDELLFPASSMFWARSKAIAKIFELNLSEEDFGKEAGQIEGTLAHVVERLLGEVPKKSGFKLIQTYNSKFPSL